MSRPNSIPMALVLSLLLLLFSCSRAGSQENHLPNRNLAELSGSATDSPDSQLQGSWLSACQPPAPNSQYSYRIRITFADSAITETVAYFSQSGCPQGQLATLPQSFEGGYYIESPNALPSGGYALDLSQPVGGLQPYNLVFLTNGQLMLGDTTGANAGSSPALRPTAPYNAVPFTKQ